MQTPDDGLKALRTAVEGLTYPSDSDEPFDVFLWEGSGSARDQVAAHAGKGRNIEEVRVETFFAQLDDADDAPRYANVRKILQSTLRDLRVFRVGTGEVSVDIYLIGSTRSAEWAGLHTVSIET